MLDTTKHKTQDGDKQKQKHNIICVGHHYTQTNINKVNKTWTLLSQTTLGKHYHNWSGFIFIFCYYTVGEVELWHVILDQMNNKDRNHAYATLGTQATGRRQAKQKTQHRKLERWATRTPPKYRG